MGQAKPVIDTVVDGLHFRSITAADQEQFMAVRREASDIAAAYEMEGFADFMWGRILAATDEVDMMVFDGSDGRFLATCSFQSIDCDPVSLGCDVVAEHRGKGHGTAIVRALIALAHATYPDRRIIVQIRKGNIASQRVAEKCGGRYIENVDTPEAVSLQVLLEGQLDQDRAEAVREMIARGHDAVKVYEV